MDLTTAGGVQTMFAIFGKRNFFSALLFISKRPQVRMSLHLMYLVLIFGRDLSPNVFLHRSQGLRANPNLALDWLNQCMSDHSECFQQPQVGRPTRLLQISDSNEGKGEPQLHLIETDNASKPYVALSHCWGTIQPVRTTKENYECTRTASSSRAFQDLSKML